MINLIFSLPRDAKEAARIEKAKQYEEERKKRIFNARNRLYGIDKEALEKQIAEKKARDEEEKAKEEAYCQKMIRDSQIAIELDKALQEKKRKLEEDINKFRLEHQRKEDRREYDLNDPDFLKKSLPCRVLDDDPRLSISGAQKFEGEDMSAKKRQQYQMEQQKAWLQQQADERSRAENEKKLAEQAYEEAIIARDERAKKLEYLEQECRKQLEEATARFNQAMAVEQATRRKMQEMRDLEDKQAAIYNAITGDFLTENPEAAQSCLGQNRIVGSAYKGMPPHEKEAIIKEQLKQIEENKKKRAEEKKLENDWIEMTRHLAKTATLNEQEMMQKQRELNRQLLEQNKLLSVEQRKNKDLFNKVKNSPGVTEEFFSQFNTTTR